eukprot:CAMPEP_0206528086 /NCGR_PEP_ID=MMETSP0325_2-20121206/1742_1 /ASSEMBLY_ACC=CAM_ASM_000347 /TAXON_ID=2866 /ORGANISM="Crypthecodinium cohnii, Strain Seligo" /LENGTH=232 /DNA_ID=CAMNT_0054023635 /DNA_START=75 /DNA_END=771 /DNA_ORIENTATION=-
MTSQSKSGALKLQPPLLVSNVQLCCRGSLTPKGESLLVALAMRWCLPLLSGPQTVRKTRINVTNGRQSLDFLPSWKFRAQTILFHISEVTSWTSLRYNLGVVAIVVLSRTQACRAGVEHLQIFRHPLQLSLAWNGPAREAIWLFVLADPQPFTRVRVVPRARIPGRFPQAVVDGAKAGDLDLFLCAEGDLLKVASRPETALANAGCDRCRSEPLPSLPVLSRRGDPTTLQWA